MVWGYAKGGANGMSELGRPTKYDPKYCDEIIEYFNDDAYRECVDANGKEYLMPNKFNTLAAWCASIGIHRDTMHEWSKVHPEFSDSLKKAKALQEAQLVTGAMSGAYASSFAIFTAKNILRWRDRVEQQVVVSDDFNSVISSSDDDDAE